MAEVRAQLLMKLLKFIYNNLHLLERERVFFIIFLLKLYLLTVYYVDLPDFCYYLLYFCIFCQLVFIICLINKPFITCNFYIMFFALNYLQVYKTVAVFFYFNFNLFQFLLLFLVVWPMGRSK